MALSGKAATAIMHGLALALAALLVFGVGIADFDLRRLGVQSLGPEPVIHSPFMRGIHRLREHDLYDPATADRRRLVLLGASTVESLTCDTTIMQNAHYGCSLARHLQDQLNQRGRADWRVYSLARAGARMTDSLYLAARIQDVKPDLIVMGDVFGYAIYENGNADQLGPAEYEFLDRTFAAPDTAEIWAAYKQTLRTQGWRPGTVDPVAPVTLLHDHPLNRPGAPVTINRWLSVWIPAARLAYGARDMPAAIRLDTALIREGAATRHWGPRAPFVNPDPGFRYYAALALIDALQRRHGGRFVFYLSPEYDNRHNRAYRAGVSDLLAGFTASHGVEMIDLIGLELRPVTETYDGHHQTDSGNRILAGALLDALTARGVLDRGAAP